MVSLEEKIKAHSHRNISATHKSTIEITREPYLTLQGGCIIGVGADKGAKDLSEELKQLLRRPASRSTLTIAAGGLQEPVHGKGHPKLSFENPTSMVFRRSGFICGRTVMIWADRAAMALSRELVNILTQNVSRIEFILEATA